MPSSTCPAHGHAQVDDRVKSAENLRDASLASVLLYGLALDEEDPALGVLLGARRELGLISNLAETTKPGVSFDITEFVPVLEGIGRRLDVVIELITRTKRAASAPPANEAPPSAPTASEPTVGEREP